MNNQRGFILIELIAVIVLIGIIGTFTGFFLYTGMNGYLKNKNITEGALNAQMALDRISLELLNINEITPTPSSTSVTYKSATLTGTRTLKYVGQQIIIRIDPDDYTLLEDVSSFMLSYTYQNLDHDTVPVDEVAHIDVEFNLSEIDRTFKTKIFPRNMVEKTW
jgi:prepilin-type N-terminal cleavage/methylation domain-containing protein